MRMRVMVDNNTTQLRIIESTETTGLGKATGEGVIMRVIMPCCAKDSAHCS